MQKKGGGTRAERNCERERGAREVKTLTPICLVTKRGLNFSNCFISDRRTGQVHERKVWRRVSSDETDVAGFDNSLKMSILIFSLLSSFCPE